MTKLEGNHNSRFRFKEKVKGFHRLTIQSHKGLKEQLKKSFKKEAYRKMRNKLINSFKNKEVHQGQEQEHIQMKFKAKDKLHQENHLRK